MTKRTFTKRELGDIVEKHRKWLTDKNTGERADLSYGHLSDSNLRGSDLRGSNLTGSDLNNSDLSYSNLSFSNLSNSDLSNSNLTGSDLSNSDLSFSNLGYSDLRGSDLRGSDLRGSNLSGIQGLLSPDTWMKENLERVEEGYIAYKGFGNSFASPTYWKIEVGQEISEVVNPLPTLNCACGVNVATKDWKDLPETGVWKVLIKWEWLPTVVIPYNTDGKFRCGRVLLLEMAR